MKTVWIVNVYGLFESVWTTEKKAKAECERWKREEGGEGCAECFNVSLNQKGESTY